MNPSCVQIEDWRRYVRDGEQYLRTAREAVQKRRAVFTPEILYNLVAMSIEKSIMGYLMSRGDLAENHTMGDLAVALERNAGPLPGLTSGLRRLDRYQEICDLDAYKRRPPSAAEIPAMLEIGQSVREWVAEQTGIA